MVDFANWVQSLSTFQFSALMASIIAPTIVLILWPKILESSPRIRELSQAFSHAFSSAVRKALDRARERLTIGSAEYIPFDNLIDVVSEIDMKPIGTKGLRCGELPRGTSLMCWPDGSVRLALPIRVSISAGEPTVHIGVQGEPDESREEKG